MRWLSELDAETGKRVKTSATSPNGAPCVLATKVAECRAGRGPARRRHRNHIEASAFPLRAGLFCRTCSTQSGLLAPGSGLAPLMPTHMTRKATHRLCGELGTDTSSHIATCLAFRSAIVQLLPRAPDFVHGPPFVQYLRFVDGWAPLGPRVDAERG